MNATATLDLAGILSLYDSSILQARVKLARHADPKYDIRLIVESGFLPEFEARQNRPVFDDCDYVLSFLGEQGARSRFLRCARVEGVAENPSPYPQGFPYPEMEPCRYRYDLRPVEVLRDLEGRLVIDWGASTRSWVQWLNPDKPKAVVEIRAPGRGVDFPGYDDVFLSFSQLAEIIEHPEANPSWHSALSAVAGIYLILDEGSGNQYVGAAWGEEGLLGRWKSYAATLHGGNKLLRAMLDQDPEGYRRFRFSILRTLPRTMTPTQVQEIEGLYKRMLGTRAFGLNGN